MYVYVERDGEDEKARWDVEGNGLPTSGGRRRKITNNTHVDQRLQDMHRNMVVPRCSPI